MYTLVSRVVRGQHAMVDKSPTVLSCVRMKSCAGKTTLLKLIQGDLTPQTGAIQRNISEISYCSQQFSLWDEFTPLEIVRFFLCGRNTPEFHLNNILPPLLYKMRFLQQTPLASKLLGIVP
jgi:ABC-type nitrate/sulfonate/bicarbonate transport system ATPase subunit